MKNSSIRTWLCSMALVCLVSTVFAQTKPATTTTITKPKTSTTTPPKSTSGVTTGQTGTVTAANPKTQAEVERMLKEGKSKEEIFAELQGKYSSKDLVLSLRTPKTPTSSTGSGQPTTPVFTEDDKNDAVEMVRSMPLNRGYLSVEQMNAIVQVYGVPNLNVWWNILYAAELITNNTLLNWSEVFGNWLLSNGGPQWQNQYIPEICTMYNTFGATVGVAYSEFYIGARNMGPPLVRSVAGNLISGVENRNTVFTTLLSEFEVTEQALYRSTLDVFENNSEERILIAMNKMDELRGVKTAVYWAQVFKMENVKSELNSICEPYPMDKALRLLTQKYSTAVATQAVRDVYQ